MELLSHRQTFATAFAIQFLLLSIRNQLNKIHLLDLSLRAACERCPSSFRKVHFESDNHLCAVRKYVYDCIAFIRCAHAWACYAFAEMINIPLFAIDRVLFARTNTFPSNLPFYRCDDE